MTGESVDFEIDTNPVKAGESREEESRQGERVHVDGFIPYSATHLYGDEENVLLDDDEAKKIYQKYKSPEKLINKVSYEI